MALTGYSTLRYIAYDILETLKQTYDDAEITLAQAVYWVMVHADKLKKAHIGKNPGGAYLTIFEGVAVEVDPVNGRNYMVLPENIYDYDFDRGIAYIAYPAAVDPDYPAFAGTQFSRTTIQEARRLYFRDDEKPSPSNPFMYRVGDRVYFLGTEQIHFREAEVGLYASFNPTDTALDIDAPFDFPQDLLPVLKGEVLKMGLFMRQMPKDLVNDGTSGNKMAVTQKAPVNDEQPQQQQTE
jgi:hypothetical protein